MLAEPGRFTVTASGHRVLAPGGRQGFRRACGSISRDDLWFQFDRRCLLVAPPRESPRQKIRITRSCHSISPKPTCDAATGKLPGSNWARCCGSIRAIARREGCWQRSTDRPRTRPIIEPARIGRRSGAVWPWGSAGGERRSEVGRQRAAPDWGEPLPEVVDDWQRRRHWQRGNRMPLEVRCGVRRRPCRSDLLRILIAAAGRLSQRVLLIAGRKAEAGDGPMLAATTALRRPMPGAASHPALIAQAMEPPPVAVHAGSAVRTAPGAGGRQQARDQQDHEQRQQDCQAQ